MTARHGAAGDLIDIPQLIEYEIPETSVASRQWSFSHENGSVPPDFTQDEPIRQVPEPSGRRSTWLLAPTIEARYHGCPLDQPDSGQKLEFQDRRSDSQGGSVSSIRPIGGVT